MSAHRQNWVAAVAKVAKPLVKYIALEYGKAWLDRFRASDRPTQKRMLLSVSDKMGKLALVGGPVNWVLVRASKKMRESDAVLNTVADILSNEQATDKIVGSAKQMTASSSTSAAANPRRRNNALGRSYSKTRKRTGKWGAPTKIQSLLFGKGWSPSAAQDWAMEHGFNAHAIDQPAEYIRIRQAAPAAFNKSTLRTITLTDKYGSPIKAITGVRLPVDYKKKQEAKVAKAANRNPGMSFTDLVDAVVFILGTKSTRVPARGAIYTNFLHYFDEPPDRVRKALDYAVKQGRLTKDRSGWRLATKNPRRRKAKAAYCRVCQGPHHPHKKARR